MHYFVHVNNRDLKKRDSLRGRKEAKGSQRGTHGSGVPCAELTALAVSQSTAWASMAVLRSSVMKSSLNVGCAAR